MFILAIDTALDACAAGVLDTRSSRLVAHESLLMKRGHAEALMPLIARVMKASGVAFAALDRIAATTGRQLNDPSKWLEPATHRQWLSRMLNNLQAIFAQTGRERDLYAMQELQELLL